MSSPFRLDRSWEFPVSPGELWSLLSRTGDYRSWFGWIRSLEAPGGLAQGARATCEIRPPVPYVLHLVIDVVGLVPKRSVDAEVSGDLRGGARLDIDETDRGSRARLAWEVTMGRPALDLAARVARPLMQWGHDWCVEAGVARFRTRALAPRPRGEPTQGG